MAINYVILGTGAIGRAIMEELVKRGESVRMVNRSGEMDEIPAGVEVVGSDLYDQAMVKKVTRGAKVVYQSAQPSYFEWPEKFPPLQKSIIDGLTGSDTKLVLVENLYMYGVTNGTPMTEDMPHNAHTVTAGRGSDFFGPWGLSSSMGERVFYPLLSGRAAQMIGRLDISHSHTYVPDFGKALVILGENNEADGQAWHVPNDNPCVTQREMLKMIAAEMGIEPKMSTMGKLMMLVGGLFIPEAKESVEMMYEFDQPFIVDSSKFERTFGIKATPMRKAIKETVAWFKNHSEK